MGGRESRHRLFFALQPGPRTCAAIHSIQRQLAGGRPVPPERLHATLIFLGMQSADTLSGLKTIASSLAFPSCKVLLDRLGHFPGARVAWLGPNKTPAALEDFRRRLAASVSDAGIEFDSRVWRMHVTLYRDLRTRPAIIDFEPVEWPVRGFCLMESLQGKSGLQYLPRGRWPG